MTDTTSKNLGVGVIVAGVVALLGICLWIYQAMAGFQVTGMRNLDSWGLYIACFMFFIGLAAGSMLIGVAPRVVGFEGFGRTDKVAAWVAISCAVAGVGFVAVDLGQPARLWELLLYSNFSSPLMWDMIVVALFIIVAAVYLWAAIRADKGETDARTVRVIGVLGVVASVLVLTVDAWFLSLSTAHELWHTALLGPWFVSSALVCGSALVLLVSMGLAKAGRLDFGEAEAGKLAKVLGAFIVVDLYFFCCDLVTSGYMGTAEGAQIVAMLTGGALAPFFWVEVIGCIIAAVICFAPSLRKQNLLVVAGVLALIGIFCKRIQLLLGGFQMGNLDYAAPMSFQQVASDASSMQLAFSGLAYTPSAVELGVAVGVTALAVFLVLVGLKKLPLGLDA